MKYLALIPGLVSLLLVAACFVTVAGRRSREGSGLVSLPFAAAGAGMLALIFCVPATILLWEGNLLGLAILAFTALGWALMLAYCNCWIDYDQEGFTHSNLLGIRRRFSYADIAPICKARYKQALAGHDLRFRAGRRSVLIDTMSQNREDFLLTLSKRLRRDQWTEEAPRGWDPYGHNVPQPDGWFLFVVIHLLLLALFVFFVLVVAAYFSPAETPESTDHVVLSFLDYREGGKGNWNLNASDGKQYYLDTDTKKLGLSPETVCDGKTVYDVYLHHGTRSIEALRTQAGEDLLTFAQSNELSNRDNKIGIPIFLLFLAALVWVDVGMIRTARHPERYSVRYRRFFWQDNYLISDIALSKDNPRRKQYRRKQK